MRRPFKKLIPVFVIAGSLCLAGAAQNSDIYFLIKKNFTLFSEVFREVSLNYVEEVDPEQVMRKGMDAMLESLDPYTVFIDEEQNRDLEIMTRGNYAGVGLEVGFRGSRIIVIAPMEGYPAYRRGIRAGDEILSVNGIPVEGLSPDEVENLLIGEAGSTVVLTIRRFGVDRELEFELKRERIEIRNVAFAGLAGGNQKTGYILLSRFSHNAAEEIREAISELSSRTELNGLILDLRNNPGGLLEEAVATVDKFVEPGLTVVETRGRTNEHYNQFKTREPALLKDLPLVVLQNGGSASASEIVAGALQDLDRAVIIGESSFGKGLVQIVKPLSYNASLKMTISRYFIPSGRSIQSVTYSHDRLNTGQDIPDSLRKAFKTRNGRTVFDGQGIMPDILLEQHQPTLLETALLKDNHFFFFANEYVAEHEAFENDLVSAELYREFRNYLKKSNFDYKTAVEQYLEPLETHIAANGINEKAAEDLRSFKTTIEREKEREFEKQSEMLKERLYLELMYRYKGQSVEYAESIRHDDFVLEAVDVINDMNRYREILGLADN